MNVCLLDPRIFVDDKDQGPYVAHNRILECAGKSAIAEHTLVSSPCDADLVILALTSTAFGPHFELIRRHPLTRQIRNKLVVYCPNDNQLPSLRGLYPTIGKKWVDNHWSHPCHYLSEYILQLNILDRETQNKDILCSFVGSAKNHPVRDKILRECPKDQFYLFDSTHNRNDPWWWLEKNRTELEGHFRDVLLRSQFVMCPRGISASTVRLFEAMEAACVPVIVSDEIQLPQGPDWKSFCLFIKESDTSSIPQAVESWKSTARAKGQAARSAWKKYFSTESSFNYLVSSASQLLEKEAPYSPKLLLEEFLEPDRVRAKLRFLRHRFTPVRASGTEAPPGR
jgi:hypothetical protein